MKVAGKAMKRAAMKALAISTRRKPNRFRIGCAANFMMIAPTPRRRSSYRTGRASGRSQAGTSAAGGTAARGADAEEGAAHNIGAEGRQREQAQVDQRRGVAERMTHIEAPAASPRRGRGRRHQRAGTSPRPASVAPVRSRRGRGRAGRSERVEPTLLLGAHIGDVERHQNEAEHGDGDVDPENPAPIEMVVMKRRARPSTGPSKAGTVNQASAPTSPGARGRARRTIRRPTGTIMAPPMPCRTRAATRASENGRAASDRACGEDKDRSRNSSLAPNRSGAARGGMKTASASR